MHTLTRTVRFINNVVDTVYVMGTCHVSETHCSCFLTSLIVVITLIVGPREEMRHLHSLVQKCMDTYVFVNSLANIFEIYYGPLLIRRGTAN